MTTKPISRFKAAITLTISGGAISIVQNVHAVAAEAGVTDDLDTINNGIFNTELFLMADSGDTITIKGGTGNIETGDGNDVDLNGDKVAHLLYDVGNTVWKVVAVSATGGSSSGTSASNVLESHTASSSATLEFDVGSYSSPLEFILENVIPATDGAYLYAEVSDDNGSTWESASYDWTFGYADSSDTAIDLSHLSSTDASQTAYARLSSNVGSASNEGGVNGVVKLSNPANSSIYKTFNYQLDLVRPSGDVGQVTGSASFQGNTNAITNVRFKFDSGNIESGTIKMIDPTIAQVGSPNFYEDDEVRIPGEWWQDPNNTSDYYPKYRKVVSLGSLPNASSATTAHGITNYHLDSLSIYGHADNGTNVFPLPFVHESNVAYGIRFGLEGANIKVDSGTVDRSGYTGYAILEYAKTTDTPVTRAQAYGNGGAGSQVVTASSTLANNTIPKGDGSRGLADSSITDDGSVVETNLPIRAQDTQVGSTNVQVNTRGSGNRLAYLDLVGDDTYDNYGCRLIRQNDGPNSTSSLQHHGTGAFNITAHEAADIVLQTDDTTRASILAAGGLELASGNALKMDGNTVIDTDRLLNLRSYTVATLPSAGTLGRKAAASDGRKSGEGAGSGTGVEVMDDGSQWYCEDTSSAVAA